MFKERTVKPNNSYAAFPCISSGTRLPGPAICANRPEDQRIGAAVLFNSTEGRPERPPPAQAELTKTSGSGGVKRAKELGVENLCPFMVQFNNANLTPTYGECFCQW